jgi:hypothetical protein
MYLQQLSVINFKNYEEAELVFSEGVNAFLRVIMARAKPICLMLFITCRYVKAILTL